MSEKQVSGLRRLLLEDNEIRTKEDYIYMSKYMKESKVKSG